MKVSTVGLNLLVLLVSILVQSCHTKSGKRIVIENKNIRLEFNKNTGAFLTLSDLENSVDLLNGDIVEGLPWEINFPKSSKIKSLTPLTFSHSQPNKNNLVLTWEDFKELDNDIKITATITLNDKTGMSYWDISIEGLKGLEFSNVVFPKIEGLKDLGNEKLAVPEVMGELISQPREWLASLSDSDHTKIWRYPSSRLSLLHIPTKLTPTFRDVDPQPKNHIHW